MSALYTTSSAIPGAIAEAGTLDPQAVRCVWVRPVLGKNCKAAFLPSVVFKDGTDCPLACEMNDLHARQFCQRLAAIYDWPVREGRILEGSAEFAAERAYAALDDGDRAEKDGQGLVNIPGMGRLAAILAHDAGLPFGVAMEGVTRKLALLFAKIEEQGDMQPHEIKRNLHSATEAACAKLSELYQGETPNAGASTMTPEKLGVVVADYHHTKGSTDELFQSGLAAALTAGADAWKEQNDSTAEIERKTMMVLDASITHWFRLTGRKVFNA